jgi:hypothetical protein
MRFVRNNRYIRSFQQGACIQPTWRARCLSDVACGLTAVCCCARRSWIPARREGVLESQRRIFVLGQGRLWASGTTDHEDPTSPNALEENATPLKGYVGQAAIPPGAVDTLKNNISINLVDFPIFLSYESENKPADQRKI